MEKEKLLVAKKPNPLLGKSYSFALDIIAFSSKLQREKRKFVLSKQLIRSGTAIGALSEEAQQAASRLDFIHKLAIANKETHYWLRLLKNSRISGDVDGLIEKSVELKRRLVSIMKSSKSKKI